MIRLFDYIYYRLATMTLFNITSSGYYSAMGIFASCIFLNLASVAIAINVEAILNEITFGIVFAAVIALLFFRYTEERLAKLKKKYKREQNRTVKGWCVTLYVIGSSALFSILVLNR